MPRAEIKIENGRLTAFGVAISSRDGDANETIAMILFCEAAHKAGLTEHIEELFYDSSGSCGVHMNMSSLRRIDDVSFRRIENLAKEYFFQIFFDACQHGDPSVGAKKWAERMTIAAAYSK
jgi:hypothetical protein